MYADVTLALTIRGFESRRTPNAYAGGLVFVPWGIGKTVHETVCENVLILKNSLLFGKEDYPRFSSEQCKGRPCLRMDTALSQSGAKRILSAP